jgi:hypothetical protein
MVTAGYGIMHRPGMARAATQTVTGDTICEYNSTQCLDLQGNKYVAGNPIVFYGIDPTEERFRWHLDKVGVVTYNPATNTGAPFSDPSFDQYYNTDPIYYLEKSTLTGQDGCISTDPSVGDVSWQSCTANATKWVRHNLYFVNIWWTNGNRAKSALSLQDNAFSGCHDSNGDQAEVYPSYIGCNVQFQVGLHEGS